jgi:hypothetical protein
MRAAQPRRSADRALAQRIAATTISQASNAAVAEEAIAAVDSGVGTVETELLAEIEIIRNRLDAAAIP